MTIQKLIFTICFLGLLVVSNQHISPDELDNETTVTHPSVFHEELQDYKNTIQGSEDDHMMGYKPPKSLDLESNQPISPDELDNETTVTHPSVFHEELRDYKNTIQGSEDDHMMGSKPPKSLDLEKEQYRPVFEDTSSSDTSSSSDSHSSDLTDASETSSSESDVVNDMFETISEKAKELEGKALYEIDKQRKLAKLQARKYWHALKYKIMKRANATDLSGEELKGQLENAKRDAKQKWKDLKWKIRNGNDILDELIANDSGLNPDVHNMKGSTEPLV